MSLSLGFCVVNLFAFVSFLGWSFSPEKNPLVTCYLKTKAQCCECWGGKKPGGIILYLMPCFEPSSSFSPAPCLLSQARGSPQVVSPKHISPVLPGEGEVVIWLSWGAHKLLSLVLFRTLFLPFSVWFSSPLCSPCPEAEASSSPAGLGSAVSVSVSQRQSASVSCLSFPAPLRFAFSPSVTICPCALHFLSLSLSLGVSVFYLEWYQRLIRYFHYYFIGYYFLPGGLNLVAFTRLPTCKGIWDFLQSSWLRDEWCV